MIIFKELRQIKNIEPTVVALGNFDGIHIGHRVLIDEAVKDAKSAGVKSAVFTFSNHPRNELTGKLIVKNIIYDKEKYKILEDAGIDYLFSLCFDEEMQHMDPRVFIYKLLLKDFRAIEAVCGFNFRFGFKASGNHELLIAEGEKQGFKVKVINAVSVNDQIVSSTLIRKIITEGRMESVSKYLGRNYSISGEVVHGNELGRTIGFPTANIVADECMVMPPNGVYVTNCIVDGKVYKGVTNVGNKPTIGKFGKNIETNILDETIDLYNKNITIEFLCMVRAEKKFETIDALKAQISKDCNFSRAYHIKA